jgi:hypothetical protein
MTEHRERRAEFGNFSWRWILVLIAVVVEAIIFLSYLVPFALPRVEAWQAFAFLMFFGSFL